MAIDIFNEELVPIPQAARSLSKKPSPATIWRWHAKGIGGVRLETVLVGGKRYTTKAAFARFVRRLTEAADPPAPTDSQHERTERQLKDAGLL